MEQELDHTHGTRINPSAWTLTREVQAAAQGAWHTPPGTVQPLLTAPECQEE